ncbi:hypothetical protein ACC717_38155, partial [Rhizobium ruizarguesonis]
CLISAQSEALSPAQRSSQRRSDKDVQALRDEAIDLDIGVLPRDSGELRCQTLFEDRYVGLARLGHPIFDADRITAER